MTYQPGEQPISQPQDPWSSTHGIASAPTDPLPAPVRGPGQFAPGIASPTAPPTAWSAETVAYSDPYAPAEPRRSRAGLYVLVVLLVVVLGGAGGFASWWVTTKYAGELTGSPGATTTTTSPEEPSTPTPTELPYRPDRVQVGTCLTNRGTPEAPVMWVVPCDQPDTYEVLKVVNGEEIPEDDQDRFTEEITNVALCSDVPSDSWFGWNSPNDAQDYFYCMSKNVTAS